MRYRLLGSTGLRVSEIGFGAWGIGGPAKAGSTPIGWAGWDEETSRQAIRKSVEDGITFFDTADFYGLGKSEELLGEVLGSRWDGLVLATKVGHELGRDGSIRLNYSKEYILRACEQSLRRLRKDTIDLYQLHSAKIEHLEQGACIEALEELRSAGKIRYWGISLSTYEPEREGNWMLARKTGHSFQLVLNIINQRVLQGFLDRAAQQGYGVIARMPLQFGLLTGKFTPATHFDSADHRSMRLPPPLLKKGIELVDQLKPIAGRHGITLGALALKFALAHDGVSTVIPGIKTAAQASENAAASAPPDLRSEDLTALHTLFRTHLAEYLEELKQAG